MTADQKREKKKVAALAAVLQYLRAESEERVIFSAGPKAAPVAVAVPDKTKMPATAPWGISGRQAQMQMRAMVQMKAFHN